MAPVTLTVRDETTTGKEQVTVAELIRARVLQEVRAQRRQRGRAAVQRARADRGRPQRFERAQILLLVDDRQVEELDHQVTLRPDSTVTFLKLVPLVGG
jgi:hypothetical protein